MPAVPSFVSPVAPSGGADQPAVYLRREFDLPAPPVRAVLRLTGLGVVEPWANGHRVGDEVLAPGWTSYRHRLAVRSHDVTALLRAGTNALGVVVGEGWAAGRLGWENRRNLWTDRLAAWVELVVEHADGTTTVVSDTAFRAATGGTLAHSLYDGETFDARLEPDGWSEPGFDDSAWGPTEPVDWPVESLVEATAEPIRRVEELAPVSLTAQGDRVVVDHPTYPNALEAIRRYGARPVPVPVRTEGGPAGGWDLDGIDSAVRQTAARTAFLVPDFHNPTGLCLDEAGRGELARIMRDTRTTLVVDESMVDLWLDTPPPPPVASAAAGAPVVTIGSTAKSLWGGLRVGWIRADRDTIVRLAGARTAVDLGTPVMEQLAAAHLLSDVDELLERRREQLRDRRRALGAALERHLPDWEYTPGQGGMSLWARMPEPVSTALAAAAPSHGVLLAAGPRFGVQGAFEHFVRLPYTQDAAVLDDAVEAMAAAGALVSAQELEAVYLRPAQAERLRQK